MVWRSSRSTISGGTREIWRWFRTRVEATRQQRAAAHAIQARCEAVVRDLVIPMPFDATTFCSALARQRSRPIELLPLALRGLTGREVMFGVVIDKPSCDVIVYEQETSRLHQQQIILHEASHLLLGHLHARAIADTTVVLPTAMIGDGTIRHVLLRQDFADAEEQEAEMLASLILERAAVNAPLDKSGEDAATIDAVGRLAAFYRLRQGA